MTDDLDGLRISKAATGIHGFDQITAGGLPWGRTTLVCGASGCGKTLFAAEFLLRALDAHDEPGVLVSFEEDPKELVANLASIGYNLPALQEHGKLVVGRYKVDPTGVAEVGEYTLDGFLARLAADVDRVGATRVAVDSLDTLFAAFSDHDRIRHELHRLFGWFAERSISAVVTSERGDGQLTRHGVEEYISDCVLLLEHELEDDFATRRLRIVKYRGSGHGTNRYPFIIGDRGIDVVPVTSMRLTYAASDERVSSGVGALDDLLGGEGYHRGSSVLISGQAGTGKSSLATAFSLATVNRGERALHLSFEESPDQIVRNMRSIGMDVSAAVDSGRLRLVATRPTSLGLEGHLEQISDLIDDFHPASVVLDPISALESAGDRADVMLMLMRLIDELRAGGVTGVFTSLIGGISREERTPETGISSLIDTWLLVRNLEQDAELNRTIQVLKARGTAHSNQIREFVLSSDGIQLLPVQVIGGRVLTGAARSMAEAEVAEAEEEDRMAQERIDQRLKAMQAALEHNIEQLKAQHTAEVAALTTELSHRARRADRERQDSEAARDRRAGGGPFDD